jgi:hypothetical protein
VQAEGVYARLYRGQFRSADLGLTV